MTRESQIYFENLRREAEGYIELGMYQHALDLLQKLNRSFPIIDLGVMYLQGECLRVLDRCCEAWRIMESVTAIQPGNIHVLVNLAWTQKRAGRIDLACDSIREALYFEPNNALLHFHVACYYSLLGEKRKSVDHLGRALVLDPTFHGMVPEEPDFDPVRNEPEFVHLLGGAA